MPFAATWMHLEIVTLSEVSHRQVSYAIAYMWNLKKMVQMNLFTNRNRVRYRKQTHGYQGGKRAGGRDKLGDWG